GSSPALTSPCCPPRDGDEGHVPAWGRPAVGPGLRLRLVLGVPKGYREGLDSARGFPPRPLTSTVLQTGMTIESVHGPAPDHDRERVVLWTVPGCRTRPRPRCQRDRRRQRDGQVATAQVALLMHQVPQGCRDAHEEGPRRRRSVQACRSLPTGEPR